MHWRKLGLIYYPKSRYDWQISHAALPVAIHMEQDIFNVFFSSRDKDNRSRIGCFNLNINSLEVSSESVRPLLDLGEIGTFDESGVTTSWIVKNGNSYYLYYTGWTKGVTVPFYFYSGLAASNDLNTNFSRISRAPILGRNPIDPFLTASPCVLPSQNGWAMWYVSGKEWQLHKDGLRHYYHIKYAESENGIEWRPTGLVCIDFENEQEYAFARPSVLIENGTYRMWYAFRGTRYLIGYAESSDGKLWKRMDGEAGIQPSAHGWDSEMIEYPFVFRHGENLYMLYNGNDYGKTGIGLAVLD